jgi:pimeloyl-ACP methyl ester carboxylesterase
MTRPLPFVRAACGFRQQLQPLRRQGTPDVKRLTAILAAAIGLLIAAGSVVHATDQPTVILVHGAFAESSSWDGVVKKLGAAGYPVIGLATRFAA